jgi:hypothetical protein
MTKTTFFIVSLLMSLTAWGMDYPVCKRESEIAYRQNLVRKLTNTEAEAIVSSLRDNERQKIQRAMERELACPCENNNPGLQSLLLFVETDFVRIRDSLLGEVSQVGVAAATRAAEKVLSDCQTREHRLHQELLQEAQLSYQRNPGNDPKLTVMAENTFGLRGFIRESADGTTKTFAFAGSQTLLDWNCNLNPFENKCSNQLKLALDRYLPSAVAWVKSGKKINCTGHSLGGAMAEGFCAAIMREVRKDTQNFPDFGEYSKDNRIKVVTFNALGGSETFRKAIELYEQKRVLASAVPVPAGPNSWLNTSTVHYRVEGDPLAQYVRTPHLMRTVFEKPATRRVPRSGSRELAGLRNMVSSVSDAIDDGWRQLTGGQADGHATVRSGEFCQASQDPLGAHDIASCQEIVQGSGGWVESRVARVDVPAQY